MDVVDIRFVPHSDMSIKDVSIVKEHSNLTKKQQFSDATALLDNQAYDKGFRASLFNSMQNKIKLIQMYLLGKEDTFSDTEPTEEDKQFWLQDY